MQFSDSIRLIKTFSLKRLSNYLILLISYLVSILLKKNLHKGNPTSLSIEPAAICNLKCPQCPVGNNMLKRSKGLMSMENYQKIVTQNAPHLMHLILYFQGEPFLNKNIIDMIKFAKKKRLYVQTSTNAQQIDKEIARKLVESRLDKLIISLDGTTQETYARYRKNADLSLSLDGINNIVYYKELLKTKSPLIEIQFLVLKDNEHQIEEIRALSKKLKADKLSLKTAQVYDFEHDTHFIPQNNKYSRYKKENGIYVLKRKIKNRCFKMWHSAVITWDGILVPCCYDKDANYNMGNVLDNELKEQWRSVAYEELRQRILTDRKSIKMCTNCTE